MTDKDLWTCSTRGADKIMGCKPAVELDNNLARAVVIDVLKLANVACSAAKKREELRLHISVMSVFMKLSFRMALPISPSQPEK